MTVKRVDDLRLTVPFTFQERILHIFFCQELIQFLIRISQNLQGLALICRQQLLLTLGNVLLKHRHLCFISCIINSSELLPAFYFLSFNSTERVYFYM